MQQIFLGNYKFVLVVDHLRHEFNSEKLVQNWIGGTQPLYNLGILLSNSFKSNLSNNTTKLEDIEVDANVLIPISTLCHLYTCEAIFKFIHKLKKHLNKQIFGWLSVDHIENKFIQPYLEHMANIIVTITDAKNVSILIKKSGGGVSKKFYEYVIKNNVMLLKEIHREAAKEKIEKEEIDPESLATFKIIAEEDELVARNALKLPYERINPASGSTESKIIYNPDSDDDFDEEDPDEDLYI